MSPFDFVDHGMCIDDTVEIDVGALTYRIRIQWTAQPHSRLGHIC